MSAGHTAHLYVNRDSPLHRLAPEVKLVGIFTFVFVVALTPRRAVPAFAIDAGLVLIAMAVARFRPREILARLVAVLPFVTFAFLIPFIAGGPKTDVAGISLSIEGLWGTWNILAKALLGVSASALLSGTTRVPEILRGLTRLRVPTVITSIIAFMFRYLDLIVEEMGRMRTAMTSRGHNPRWLWQAKPIASASGALFVRTYERGERVHAAMTARGFTGAMPEFDQRRARPAEWLLSVAAPVLAGIAALTGMVLT